MKPVFWGTLLIVLWGLPGCVTETVKSTSVPALKSPALTIPEAELLDLGIVVFDPGIKNTEEDPFTYPELRKAEATFIATKLAEVLTEQGAWGAVRVVPDDGQFSDLSVHGTILKSDGESLSLQVQVTDSRGRLLLDKRYSDTTSKYAYQQNTREKMDPFLTVYRTIANEILASFSRLPVLDRQTIRQVTEMRFAQDFAEEAFREYLHKDEKGQLRIRRLPAENDPMLTRVRELRQRHAIFIDTLQGHYTVFADDMFVPYQEWRKASYGETVALRELQTEARQKMIAGGASILAGIVAQSSSSRNTRNAGAIGVIGGGALLKSGLEKRAESNIHSLALEELGQSLDAEITPKVINLEDRTVRLSGNVQDQYNQWRELLADIYATEVASLKSQSNTGEADND